MRKRLVFVGRVQGVGFRATTRSFARDLPLTGFVRNETDGSVTLEAQGEPDHIGTLLARVHESLGRLISHVREHQIPEEPDEDDFRIQR